MVKAVSRLSDYSPPPYLADEVSMTVKLDHEVCEVCTSQRLRRNPELARSGPLVLNGRDQELLEVRLDGVLLAAGQYQLSDDHLTLPVESDEFELTITTRVRPSGNRSALGLFPDGRNLVTHMEPNGFSRITYFQDRPDVLSRFTVRLEADREAFPVLLSNGNLQEKGSLEEGRHYAVWHDPHPKPCYIFAIVAGHYQRDGMVFETRSGRRVGVNIYATDRHRGKTAFALDVLQRSMQWDEDAFGFEYDLDLFNVAVVDTHAIAQENKGLNILEAALISTDPATSTDEDYDLVERIIAHEYFHNWTGNRITCRDWFQLSLKEGLTRYRDQMFAESSGVPDLKRISFVRALRTNQFPEDRGGGAHPVRPESYESISNLYTATVYDKGAEIIRMLSVMLGERDFVRGVALYAQRQDGRAATIEDLLSAMEEVSGSRLEQFKLWYSAVGAPVVEMHQDYNEADRTLDIRFRQSRPSAADTASPLHMPLRLAVLSPLGHVRDLGVMELRTRDASLRVEDVEPGSVISANRGFSAPIILKADYSADDLVKLVLHEPDAVARWDAMQSLMCTAVLETMSGSAEISTASSSLVDAVGHMLAQADTPPGVKAELLTFVHIGLVSDHLEEIDVDQIAGAIERLRRKIAVTHRETLVSLFERCSEAVEFSRTADARGRRKLRAVCLEYLLELEEEAYEALALAEIRSGAGMTAKSAALYAICDHQGALRGEAVTSFLDQYGHVPEALRIWFRAQALSRQPGTADIVRQLSAHPAFDISKTPLAMALFGGFFRQNRAGFHERSGAGYRLWGEIILATDRLRPQGTKWLMPQMMNWRRFDPGRREMMKSQLEFVAAQTGISPTLAENVRQALENGGSADR